MLLRRSLTFFQGITERVNQILLRPIIDFFSRLWHRLSHRNQHWVNNVLIGVAIEIVIVYLGHHLHWPVIVNAQNASMDTIARLNAGTCNWMTREGQPNFASTARKLLNCPSVTGDARVPLLLEVDAKTWRNPSWGGGEPDRAPRKQLIELIDRSFALGARQVIVDIAIEDRASLGLPGAQSSVEDTEFAQGLSELLRKPYFQADRQLILVRTERRALPEDRSNFAPEIRVSRAIDPVVAESNGRIKIAAPYFAIHADSVLRDWRLFRVVCARSSDEPSRGQFRAIPSVQLVALAHHHQVRLPESAKNDLKSTETIRNPNACEPFPTNGNQDEAAQKTQGNRLELSQTYWAQVKNAFAGKVELEDFPNSGEIGNRVAFRNHFDSMQRVRAGDFLGLSTELTQAYKSTFLGRIVLIGQTFEEAGDVYQTPLGSMPGVAVLLNSIDSMFTHQLMRQVPMWAELFYVTLLIVFVGFIYSRFGTFKGTVGATIVIVIAAGAISWLLSARGVWLDVAAPLSGIQLHRWVSMWEDHIKLQRMVSNRTKDH